MVISVELVKVSVKEAGIQFHGKMLYLNCDLKLWGEGKTPGVDDPDLVVPVFGKYSYVEELSLIQRLILTKNDLVLKCQIIIDAFIRQQTMLARVEVDDVISTAYGELDLGV